MKISVAKLRRSSNFLFDHLEEEGHSYIELDHDYYWQIDHPEELYDPLNEPKDLGLGQLYDDYEYIQQVADGERETISYDAVWLSSILRYIGEKIIS